MGLSRLPAGTTNSAPSICTVGAAEPQVEQKPFTCLVEGTWNVLIEDSPQSHSIFALTEKRFAACAEPVSFRHRLQWQRKK